MRMEWVRKISGSQMSLQSIQHELQFAGMDALEQRAFMDALEASRGKKPDISLILWC